MWKEAVADRHHILSDAGSRELLGYLQSNELCDLP